MLHEVPAADSTLVESVVLFTDGKANFGIKDPAALSKATRYTWVCNKKRHCINYPV